MQDALKGILEQVNAGNFREAGAPVPAAQRSSIGVSCSQAIGD